MIVFGVWVSGFAAIALTRLRGWRRIWAAVRTSTPLTIPGVGLQASVQVRSLPGLLEPGIVGLWRPILLVPAGIEQHLTAPQLEPTDGPKGFIVIDRVERASPDSSSPNVEAPARARGGGAGAGR